MDAVDALWKSRDVKKIHSNSEAIGTGSKYQGITAQPL